MRFFLLSLLAVLWLSLCGCATTTTHTPAVPLTGDILVDGPNAVRTGPERDRVLWAYRTASAAMRRGNPTLAKEMLDEAILSLGGIASGEKSAKQSRGYFHSESRKNFRGEPYERVMAYVYRGILYWMDGEPDNARACFRSAQLQDADSENNEYKADYMLLDYWEGLATQRLGGDGSDAWKRAKENARINQPAPYDASQNVLVFLEFGPGPLKYATGAYGEQLRFRITPSRAQFAVVKAAEQQVKVGAFDDLGFQATTRGGRVMDHVLANKAVFKSTTGKLGDAALISGAILATQGGHDTAADEVGAGLMVAGLIGKIVSAATTPAADVRMWETLPHYLSFAALRLPPGEHVITVEYQDAAGVAMQGMNKQFTITVSDKDKAIFVSDQSSTPQKL